MIERSKHWNSVYETRASTEVSWFQQVPRTSLELIAASGVACSQPVLDVGAGASNLVDGLLDKGFSDITLLDVAEAAFAETRRRLGQRAEQFVHYVVSDVIQWTPSRSYALWHDRAVFHFLTNVGERDAYRKVLASAIPPAGQVILATFAPDGPDRCSGLPVRRYSAESLALEFNGLLRLVEAENETHTTPAGRAQAFVFARFERE